LDKAIKFYREYYSEKGLYENRLYDGIEELLKNLKNDNRSVYLVTVKPAIFAKKILKHFKIFELFSDIYGSDLSNYNDTKEKLIKKLLDKEKAAQESAAMIGDREFDVIGAKHNKVTSIAVGYGYGSEEELLATKPDFFVKSVKDLSNLLCK